MGSLSAVLRSTKPALRSSEAMARSRITEALPLNRAIGGVLTLGEGQRVAIMAGSGVGKSTLLGMAAKSCQAEVNVVCLVGERGREVREFLERDLGPEGLARSVVIVATSDRAPVLLVKAVQAALSVAEYFRDNGAKVMLMVDSLTRLAMAQRQIGLAAGEPPATRGTTICFTPPRLLERVDGVGGRARTIMTVLVEGDDTMILPPACRIATAHRALRKSPVMGLSSVDILEA